MEYTPRRHYGGLGVYSKEKVTYQVRPDAHIIKTITFITFFKWYQSVRRGLAETPRRLRRECGESATKVRGECEESARRGRHRGRRKYTPSRAPLGKHNIKHFKRNSKVRSKKWDQRKRRSLFDLTRPGPLAWRIIYFRVPKRIR